MLIAGREIEGIGLGTAQFAFRGGTAEDSVATVHAALDAGVMLIDTALAYTRAGVESYAEAIVARALRGLAGERPLVATKGGHRRDGDGFLLAWLRAQSPATTPLAGASKPGSIRDSATPFGLIDRDLEALRAG